MNRYTCLARWDESYTDQLEAVDCDTATEKFRDELIRYGFSQEDIEQAEITIKIKENDNNEII